MADFWLGLVVGVALYASAILIVRAAQDIRSLHRAAKDREAAR